MILGIGLDIVSLPRIRRILARHGDRFVHRILRPEEAAACLTHSDPGQRLAGRWAAKEACAKVLGTGLSHGLRWHDLFIPNTVSGAPIVVLGGLALSRAQTLGMNRLLVTITHTADHAAAVAIGES